MNNKPQKQSIISFGNYLFLHYIRISEEYSDKIYISDDLRQYATQENIDSNGHIIDKPLSLVRRAEKMMGTRLELFTRLINVGLWASTFALILLYYMFAGHYIASDDQVINLHLVFLTYVMLPLLIWFLFWVSGFFFRGSHSIVQLFAHFALPWFFEKIGFSRWNSAIRNQADLAQRVADFIVSKPAFNWYVNFKWKLIIVSSMFLGVIFSFVSFSEKESAFCLHKSNTGVEYVIDVCGLKWACKTLSFVLPYEQVEELRRMKGIIPDKDLSPHIDRKFNSQTINGTQRTNFLTFNRRCAYFILISMFFPLIPHLLQAWAYWRRYLRARNDFVPQMKPNGVFAESYFNQVVALLENLDNRPVLRSFWVGLSGNISFSIESAQPFLTRKYNNDMVLVDNLVRESNWNSFCQGINTQSREGKPIQVDRVIVICDLNDAPPVPTLEAFAELYRQPDRPDLTFVLVFDENLKSAFDSSKSQTKENLRLWKESLTEIIRGTQYHVSTPVQGIMDNHETLTFFSPQTAQPEEWDALDRNITAYRFSANLLDNLFTHIIVYFDSGNESDSVSTANVSSEPRPATTPQSRLVVHEPERVPAVASAPTPAALPPHILFIANGLNVALLQNMFKQNWGGTLPNSISFYRSIYDKGIEQFIQQNRQKNIDFNYQVCLVSKASSRFDEGAQFAMQKMFNVLFQNQASLDVKVIVTDWEQARQTGQGGAAGSILSAWKAVLDQICVRFTGKKIRYTIIDWFDYSIAPPTIWLRLRDELLPPPPGSAQTNKAAAPLDPAVRIKRFNDATDIVTSCCLSALTASEPTNEDKTEQQMEAMNAQIRNLYYSGQGFVLPAFLTSSLDGVPQKAAGIAVEYTESLQAKAVDAYEKGKQELTNGIERLGHFVSHLSFKGLLAGGAAGAIVLGTLTAPVTGGASLAAAVAVAQAALVGAGIGSAAGYTLPAIWADLKRQRRKNRRDVVFQTASVDVQERALQAELLLSNGLIWTLLYDIQGLSEEEAERAFKVILKPIDTLYVNEPKDVQEIVRQTVENWKRFYQL